MSATKETKETAAEMRERLLEQPVIVSELSLKDKISLQTELAKEIANEAMGKGGKSKAKTSSEDGAPKRDNLKKHRELKAAVKETLDELELRQTDGWLKEFLKYLKTKGFYEDPDKVNDHKELTRLYERYTSKPEGAVPEEKPKAKKTSAKKPAEPDSEDESAPKTTGGAKAKAYADSEDEEEKPKPKPVAAKAPPKPPAPKAKADNTLKTPPVGEGLIQTYKGKEVYTSLTEGAIHVWTNDDGAAGEYLGIYNPKTKEVEEVFEEVEAE